MHTLQLYPYSTVPLTIRYSNNKSIMALDKELGILQGEKVINQKILWINLFFSELPAILIGNNFLLGHFKPEESLW